MKRPLLLSFLAALMLILCPGPHSQVRAGDDAARLTRDDIVNMSNLGVADGVIISAIQSSGAVFDLAANDIIELTRAGVSQSVIQAMQKTRQAAPPAAAPEGTSGSAAPVTPAAQPAAQPSAQPLPPPNAQPQAPAPAPRKVEPSDATSRSTRVLTPTQVKPLPADVKQLKRRYETGKYTSAAAAAFDLLTGPNKERYAENQSTIYYYLAKSLYKMGYYHAAHLIFLRVAQEGPAGPHYNGCLAMLTRTSEQLKEYEGFMKVLEGTSPDDLPLRVKGTLLYLIGLNNYVHQDYTEARKAFSGVSNTSEFFGQAQFLSGMSMYRQGGSDNTRLAVRTFKGLVESSQLVGEVEDVRDIKDLALMNMARIYYRVEDYKKAETLYDLVPRDSKYWPEALYENAYTNFWQGDYNVTLGQLLTIDSPFFKGLAYIPEAGVLRALTYYNLCEYEKVLALLKAYQVQYKPVRDSIRTFLKDHEKASAGKLDQFHTDKEAMKQATNAYTALFESGSRKKGVVFPSEVLVSLEEERDFKNIHHHLGMLRKEMEEIKHGKAHWEGTTLGNTLLKQFEEDEVRLRADAGRYLLEQLSRIEKDLTNLLGQSDIIQFEVVSAQKEEAEDKFRNPEHVETYEKLEQSYATEPSLIFWPFTGEFWQDELGYYRFTERGACRTQAQK